MMDSNVEHSRGADALDEVDDDDEYEDGSRLLEFMFGNIDGSGDLDIDYLDEDAKEHLAALADKLGSSLTDIDLSVKKSHKSGYAAEQDYDLKAEDAVDYEDIDEQYEGPEVQALTEEDYLLPKSDYASTAVASSSLFDDYDDDNYDEDEEPQKELQTASLSGEVINDLPVDSQGKCSPKDGGGALAIENSEPDVMKIQKEETHIFEEPKSLTTPLPVLCVEDGNVILRFSEIFAIQEPLKKAAAKRKQRWFSVPKEKYKVMDIVEDDEEAFLKKGFPYMRHGHAFQDEVSTLDEDFPKSAVVVVDEDEIVTSDIDDLNKDYCDNDYFPLDEQDWENRIIYDNSPHISERNGVSGSPKVDEENHVSAEPESYSSCEETIYHPQLLRLESRVESRDTIKRFNKLTLRNKDLLDGVWVDRIVWDPQQSVVPKAKLLFDLEDEHMVFEVLDNQLHAGAMITTRSAGGDLLEPHGYESGGKFNISNDNFYSNRKSSQSHSKKRAGGHGVKVQNVSAIDGEENESGVEDLDSFAGDLENLLDVDEEKSNHENQVGVKGLKMRRLPSQALQVGNTKKNARKSFVCGACGQLGHMKTNKYCPKYGENSNNPIEIKHLGNMPSKSIPLDSMVTKPQQKKSRTKLALVEAPPEDERSSLKAKVLKVRWGPSTSDRETVNNRSSVKVNKKINIFFNKSRTEDIQVESHKPRKTIVFRRSKEITDLDQISQQVIEPRSKSSNRMTELSGFQNYRDDGSGDVWPNSAQNNNQFWEEDDEEETPVGSYYEEEEKVGELRRFEEAIKRERLEEMRQREKKKKKKNMMFESRNRSVGKRKPVLELGGRFSPDYTPTVKRRRGGGGQVELSNILEKIINIMKSNQGSFLFLKPVTKKEAPDYLRFVDRPMDLATIKEKARKLEYKNRKDFRHDVCQITINAHIYNDGRNPGIPPLADQLLEMCDRLLMEFEEQLDDAEDNIETDQGNH